MAVFQNPQVGQVILQAAQGISRLYESQARFAARERERIETTKMQKEAAQAKADLERTKAQIAQEQLKVSQQNAATAGKRADIAGQDLELRKMEFQRKQIQDAAGFNPIGSLGELNKGTRIVSSELWLQHAEQTYAGDDARLAAARRLAGSVSLDNAGAAADRVDRQLQSYLRDDTFMRFRRDPQGLQGESPEFQQTLRSQAQRFAQLETDFRVANDMADFLNKNRNPITAEAMKRGGLKSSFGLAANDAGYEAARETFWGADAPEREPIFQQRALNNDGKWLSGELRQRVPGVTRANFAQSMRASGYSELLKNFYLSQSGGDQQKALKQYNATLQSIYSELK